MKNRVQFPHSLQWRVNSRGLGTNLLNCVLINECISSILLSALNIVVMQKVAYFIWDEAVIGSSPIYYTMGQVM